MQIRGDYISYSNHTYDHHHHITKCLHEDQHRQQEGAAAGIKSEALSMQNAKEEAKQDPVNIYEEAKRLTDDKKGTGFFKGIWEAMGEDTTGSRPEAVHLQRRHIGTRIMAVVSMTVKHVIPYGIISSLENIREKIRTTARGALKRLGKKEEAFTALTDPKEHFTGKKDADKKFRENKEKGTRTKEGVLLTAAMSDSHLMDSYSKTGAYCRLNENLTYQKKEVLERPGKNL